MIKLKKTLLDTLVNQLMLSGNKWKSELIILKNFKTINKSEIKRLPDVVKLSIINSSPYFSLKKIQRKKKNPIEFPFLLSHKTKVLHGIKALVKNSRHKKLSGELLNSSVFAGSSVNQKTNLHKESFLKKKLSSYRWFC